jgi:hypothetical protein
MLPSMSEEDERSKVYPYCMLQCERTSVKTTVKDGCDVQWNEKFVFDVKVDDEKITNAETHRFQVDVFAATSIDPDTGKRTRGMGELLGSIVVPLRDIQTLQTLEGDFAVISDTGEMVGEVRLSMAWGRWRECFCDIYLCVFSCTFSCFFFVLLLMLFEL